MIIYKFEWKVPVEILICEILYLRGALTAREG